MSKLLVGPIAIQFLEDTEWRLTFRGITISFTGDLKLATQLPDDQEIPYVAPTTGSDVKGNPVPLKGTMAVTVSDATILSVITPDPLTPTALGSGVIRPVGPLGNAQVIFTETGDTTNPLTVVAEVTVVAGTITVLNPPILGNLRKLDTAPDPAAPVVAPNPPTVQSAG